MTGPSTAAKADLAPTGRLRVGLNYGNFLLVTRHPEGRFSGIAVDLALELGRRIGVPLDFVPYDAAGKMADGAKAGAWDVAFLGAEPARAAEIDFTAAYLEIEAGYLVPEGSALRSVADVDREGVRIAAAAKSAYDLYLSRSLKHARLVRTDGIDASLEVFVKDGLEALAGLKPRLLKDEQSMPGSRVLEGRFTAVQQAVGTPKGRSAGAAYLREFVEDMKRSGLVARAIKEHGVVGVSVAPAAPL